MARRQRLTIKKILDWSDAHFVRTGQWPRLRSAYTHVRDAPGERWDEIDACLRQGGRGLPGGSSLDRVLAKHRGLWRRIKPRHLTISQILCSADKYRKRTGQWPSIGDRCVPGMPDETWKGIDHALRYGLAGLSGGRSLAKLLVERRGMFSQRHRPRLTIKQVLRWADAHQERTGRWPTLESGQIPGTDGEEWKSVSGALEFGRRGLAGGTSLSKLLAKHRGSDNRRRKPHLSVEEILAWADRHKKRTGLWPTNYSGAVRGAPGETWKAICAAMRQGGRGLVAGKSLMILLKERRGVVSPHCKPRLTEKQILKWADAHRQRTKRWPTGGSGAIVGAPQEKWKQIDVALQLGLRGLPGGTSLSRLLDEQRRNRKPLTVHRILVWADQHKRRTGNWPKEESGPVWGWPNENWNAISQGLRRGYRGLEGGTTLARLLFEHRGAQSRNH